MGAVFQGPNAPPRAQYSVRLRRALPALGFLLALCALAGLTWLKVIDQVDDRAAAVACGSTPVDSSKVQVRVYNATAREGLARKVAEPLGIGPPDAKAAAGHAGFREPRGKPGLETAPSLSMETQGGGIHTRRVAVLLAAGAELGAYKVVQQALQEAGAITKVVAAHLGVVASSSGQQVPVDHTFQTMPSVLFDVVTVTKDNIDDTVVKDGLYKHEDIFK